MAESLRQRVQRWLDSMTCPACGKGKEKDKPFCLSCFRLLPDNMKKSLYRTWSNGFAEACDEAHEELKGLVR